MTVRVLTDTRRLPIEGKAKAQKHENRLTGRRNGTIYQEIPAYARQMVAVKNRVVYLFETLITERELPDELA